MAYSRSARRLSRALLFFIPLTALCTSPAYAQAARTGTLQVTVVDQSSAVIAGATVTVTGADNATRGATIAPTQTSPQGVASIPGLAPGVYTVQAEFPGFETRLLKEVR